MVGGWAVEGILGANSGAPLNILLGRDVVGNGRANGQRPDAVLGQDWRASGGNGFTWLNTAAFDATGPARDHRFGTLGFNTARGPGAFNWGVGIHKTIPIREKHRVMFRLEMFNVLNHMVPNNPDTNMSSATFGLITAGSAGRNIQLGLKYNF